MPAEFTPEAPTGDAVETSRPARPERGAERASTRAIGGWRAAEPRGWVSWATLAGMAAPAGFLAVVLVLGLVTPGYDWLDRYASELSLGSLGWIMIANFIALGVVEFAVAAAFGRLAGDRASGRVAAAAVGVLGAAFVTAGICVTDPAKLVTGANTWHGVVHALMAVVIFFLATPVAGLATARRLRQQRRFARYSAVTALATPALLVVTFVSGSLHGLAQRIVIAVVLAWLTSLAVQLHRANLVQR